VTEYHPTFGSIVSIWYLEEMIDEDIIEEWHALPEARGIDGSNMNKLWHVGQSMLAALAPDTEEEETSSEEESEEGSVAAPVAPKMPPQTPIVAEDSEEETSSDEDEDGDGEDDEDEDEE